VLELLSEHITKYQTAYEARLADLKSVLTEHQREYDSSTKQLRLLNQTYQVFSLLTSFLRGVMRQLFFFFSPSFGAAQRRPDPRQA